MENAPPPPASSHEAPQRWTTQEPFYFEWSVVRSVWRFKWIPPVLTLQSRFKLQMSTTKSTIRRATSEVSDKPAHPPGLTRVFAYSMCLSQPPDYTKRDEREPLPYRVDIQADMSLCWLHRSYYRFCHGLAQIKVDLLTYMLPLFNKTT